MLGQLSTFRNLACFYDLTLLRRENMSELHFMSIEELDNKLKNLTVVFISLKIIMTILFM